MRPGHAAVQYALWHGAVASNITKLHCKWRWRPIAEDTVLATKITNALQKDMEQQQNYYESLPVNKRDAPFEEERNIGLLNALHSLKQQFATPAKTPAEITAPVNTQPIAPGPADSAQKMKN